MRLSLTASFLIALVSIAGCGTAPSEPVDASGADGGSAADAAADDAASTNDDGGAGETDAATVDAATPQPCSTPGTAEMAPWRLRQRDPLLWCRSRLGLRPL